MTLKKGVANSDKKKSWHFDDASSLVLQTYLFPVPDDPDEDPPPVEPPDEEPDVPPIDPDEPVPEDPVPEADPLVSVEEPEVPPDGDVAVPPVEPPDDPEVPLPIEPPVEEPEVLPPEVPPDVPPEVLSLDRVQPARLKEATAAKAINVFTARFISSSFKSG